MIISAHELMDSYRELFLVAMAVNDHMRRETDHAVYEGGTELIDTLRDIVSNKVCLWGDFLFSQTTVVPGILGSEQNQPLNSIAETSDKP